MIKVSFLTPEEAVSTADWWGPVIQRALEHSHDQVTFAELLEDVADSEVSVWIVMKGDALVGVFVLRILESDKLRWCAVEHLAGTDMQDWITRADAVARKFARSFGCKQMVFEGRPGWARALKELGYATSQIRGYKSI